MRANDTCATMHSHVSASDRPSTTASMRFAAATGSSCSHILSTDQPALDRVSSTLRSRATLSPILLAQKVSLLFERVPCSGQPCQKQPSTYTATRTRAKTRSARDWMPGKGLVFFR